MQELKPCPFCGSEAHIEIRKMRVRINKGMPKVRKPRKITLAYSIGCSNPDCLMCNTKQQLKLLFTVSREGLNTMIRRWNRRIENPRTVTAE